MTKKEILLMIVTVAAVAIKVTSQQLKSLTTEIEWKQLDFEFPTTEMRNDALAHKTFIPENSVPVDVDVYYGANGVYKMFVTIPRLKDGVPITFGTVSEKSISGERLIKPFPSYDWQNSKGKDCDKFTSVLRVFLDQCGRLWVLDTGQAQMTQLCPPQILVFDPATGYLIHRYKFPTDLYESSSSLFASLAVNVPDIRNCINTTVYIADTFAYAIIVYDYQKNVAWKTQNELYRPNPANGSFAVDGVRFTLPKVGVVGMALSSRRTNNTPMSNPPYEASLYFHSLAAVSENRVPLNILNNQTAWNENPTFSPASFVNIGSRVSQCLSQAMDNNGNLFFGLMDPIAIACWDSSKPYTTKNMRLIVQNDEKLQFTSGMKVVNNRRGQQELWVLTNRYQRVHSGIINANETNYRILSNTLRSLLNVNQCLRSGIKF